MISFKKQNKETGCSGFSCCFTSVSVLVSRQKNKSYKKASTKSELCDFSSWIWINTFGTTVQNLLIKTYLRDDLYFLLLCWLLWNKRQIPAEVQSAYSFCMLFIWCHLVLGEVCFRKLLFSLCWTIKFFFILLLNLSHQINLSLL